MLIVPGRRSDVPSAPWEIREEVEKYARESGRHGTIHFLPEPVNAWEVRFTLKPDDKRLLAWQQDKVGDEPAETVLLIEPNPDEGKVINGKRQGANRALSIHQMGASGVRAYLEKGNTWSGRGEFSSVEAAVRKATEQNAAARQANYDQAHDMATYRARHDRLWYAKQEHEKTARIVAGKDLKQAGANAPA